jgi:hypothetical protein
LTFQVASVTVFSMRSIFLRPVIIDAVRNHHREILHSVKQLEKTIEEPASLYDLLLEPTTLHTKDEWMAIQGQWAEALNNNNGDLNKVYSQSDAHVKRTLLPFFTQMKSRSLWQTIISPDPEPEYLIDLTRFTVHWAVMQAVKHMWIYKSKTAQWSNSDYVGLPAMTSPVIKAAVLLFGENTKGSVLTAKTIHTRLSTELNRSELWVNSALRHIGKQIS